jgi:multimeric flavodoxin WrbA
MEGEIMKILVIVGSPHGMKGNTGRLLEEVLVGVRIGGGEVEIVSLSESKVLPCVSCYACHKTGICTIKDEFEDIKKKLLSSDGFIFASPNYIHSVTAQLKAFFDRCACIIHCVALEGKYGAVVETSGGGEDADVIKYMEHVINVVGAQSVGGIGSPVTGYRSFPEEDSLFAKAQEMGKLLCHSIQNKKHYPEQDAFLEAFKTRMKRLVEFQKNEWTYEHEFWQSKS